ncbi:unnamed protein product, partial [Brenthis ino]
MLNFSVFIRIILAQYPNTLDKTSNEDKIKLRILAHELLAEAKLKIHQTDEIRDRLSNQIGFQIGMIIGLEIDIERLIDVLLNIPEYMLKKPNFGHGSPPPNDGSVPPGYPPAKPPGNIKRKMRQEYLLRKLNLPTNLSTTKKRFYKKWPVEGTWSLEKMNY